MYDLVRYPGEEALKLYERAVEAWNDPFAARVDRQVSNGPRYQFRPWHGQPHVPVQWSADKPWRD